MTYRPVTNPKGGRNPLPIPPALLTMLSHSYETGRRVVIHRRREDPPGWANDLRRALIRAGYRHFPNRTIHKRFADDKIVFWMTDKRRQKGKK